MKTHISSYRLFCAFLLCCSFSITKAQDSSISGRIIDDATDSPIAGAYVLVKGLVVGTVSDENGEFTLKIKEKPPLTIVISFVGFQKEQVEITESVSEGIEVRMVEDLLMGKEVVVSASRVEEDILTSPVTIEKMDLKSIRTTASHSFYDALKTFKGIDLSAQSLTFKTINIRGFGLNGNTRTVQLIDGIDNQAPGLNFPVGNIVGISELDLESVEILPGAASALYGPNAIQGIILMKSKSPFEYQGLSAYVKGGVNHIDGEDEDPSFYQDYAVRYAKSFNNKFAFKLTASYLKANDFRGVDYRDQSDIVERSPKVDPTVEGYRRDPALRTYDGVNVYGDGLLNVGLLGQGTGAEALLPTDDRGDFSVTGYTESEFVDNNTESLKLGGALHFRPTTKLEILGQYNIGFGSTVYTANDRFVLDDFSIWTAKLELRGPTYYLRGYTTREESGDSYAANTLATLMEVQTSIPAYVETFAGARLQGASIDQAHAIAREAEIAARPAVGSPRYNQLYDSLRAVPISQGGAKFLDQTSLNHAEFMYNFANVIDWMEMIIGANFRRYNLKSDGTLFALTNIDTGDEFKMDEYGGYLQLKKTVADQRLDLIGSIRYDKNENFKGQFSPRLSTVINVGPERNHNIRASFQRGFRIPTTQDQFINLDVVTRRLVGSNSALVDQFNFKTNTVYTLESLQEAQLAGDQSLLEAWTDFDFKTEKVNSYEIGYKSLISENLLIDAYYYYNQYSDFIVEIDLVQTATGNTSEGETPLYSGPADPAGIVNQTTPVVRYGFDVNTDINVNTQGWALGIDYSFRKGYQLGGNVSFNQLLEANELKEKGFRAQYNTPEWKYNLKFGNRKATKNLGFFVNYRWQDAFFWESSFGRGVIPAFGTLDAQVSYKLSAIRTIIKLGGSNILNERYTTSFGNPRMGAIYYLSLSFDQFLN